MMVVALIPIKLNSERIPYKNILPLGKEALCYYVPNTMLKVRGIDEVYVYCSDEKVIDYLPEGVKFLKRDTRLDGNQVKGKEIYDAFIKAVDADIYVLAHTTSPFIKKETVERALSAVVSENYDSAFSAQRIQTFSWYQNKPINYSLDNIPRTQDIEPVYVETSGFYIFKKDLWVDNNRRIGETPYIQEVDNIEAIDIDEMEQFEFAKLIADQYLV